MKAIRYTGLILFLFSLGLFIGSFFMSNFTLTEETFNSNVKEEHQERLRPALSSSFGKTYSPSIPFVKNIKKAIEKVNSEARANQEWDKVIYDDYTGLLTRASAEGFVPNNKVLVFILIYVVGTIGSL
ncbi:MAG: FeS-binding protein, partial [Bacteroidota bacterium]